MKDWYDPDDPYALTIDAKRRHSMVDSFGNTYMVHSPALCALDRCVIHNASMHHMIHWPWKMDTTNYCVWRICLCGKAHPDPDSQSYFSDLWAIEMLHNCCLKNCCKMKIVTHY